jgi:isopropylmalate/homocitrate/citramalate synthase
VPDEVMSGYQKALEDAQEKYAKAYTNAARPTPEDVQSVRDMSEGWRDDVKKEFEEYMSLFGIEFGSEKAKKELSALQQGIQGITETTAGALEAYMNGVSQQVYYQSDLLTQIRDAVVSFNLDVQVATMSQILLQLQSSYTVQMSIQGILEGWSSPSGLAVRVEMQ